MNSIVFRSAGLAIGVAAAWALAGCDVDQTREGELPQVDVDVDAEEGQLPRYDVDAPDVDVAVRDREVTVPDVDVDVDAEQRTIPVPDVDIDLPEEADDALEPDPEPAPRE